MPLRHTCFFLGTMELFFCSVAAEDHSIWAALETENSCFPVPNSLLVGGGALPDCKTSPNIKELFHSFSPGA